MKTYIFNCIKKMKKIMKKTQHVHVGFLLIIVTFKDYPPKSSNLMFSSARPKSSPIF